MKGENYFIGIAGIIGAGKTTFTTELAKHLNYKPYFEPVKENPYLDDFYESTERWAVLMQLHLLHARFKQHQEIVWSGKGAVQDRTIYEDTIFAETLKNEGHIKEREMKTYQNAFSNMIKYLIYPDIIVYLDVAPENALKRIMKRKRDAEIGISLDYLEKLHQGYQKFIKEMSNYTKIIKIDWNNYGNIAKIAQIIKNECSDNKKFLRTI